MIFWRFNLFVPSMAKFYAESERAIDIELKYSLNCLFTFQPAKGGSQFNLVLVSCWDGDLAFFSTNLDIPQIIVVAMSSFLLASSSN